MMNLPKTILKAIILATTIFWLILTATEGFNEDRIYLVFLSLIPISICCSLVIALTISPFFWLKKSGDSNRLVFKKYFPFYTIISFSLCLYGTLQDPLIICFYLSAFFTTMQTWVWLAKGNEQQNKLEV